MNSHWIQKSLDYHGLPLKSVWDSERGDELSRLGLQNIDYSLYRARQKSLSTNSRGFRLKLHQFIAKNASVLFGPQSEDQVSSTGEDVDSPVDKVSAKWLADYKESLPPLEYFLKGLEPERFDRLFQVTNFKFGFVTLHDNRFDPLLDNPAWRFGLRQKVISPKLSQSVLHCGQAIVLCGGFALEGELI